VLTLCSAGSISAYLFVKLEEFEVGRDGVLVLELDLLLEGGLGQGARVLRGGEMRPGPGGVVVGVVNRRVLMGEGRP
jgi:hypothetical protein